MTGPGQSAPRTVVHTSEHDLVWRRTPLLAHLAVVPALLLVVAVATGRAEVVAVAAPCLVVLAVAGWRPRPAQVRLEVGDDSGEGVHEGEPVTVRARLVSPVPLGASEIRLDVSGPAGLQTPRRQLVHGERAHAVWWELRPRRWGRWAVGPVVAELRSAGGTMTASLAATGGRVLVDPRPALARDLAVGGRLVRRAGGHTSRRPGAGIEFVGLRDYAPGDAVRRINWAASSRRQSLVVNEQAAELAADVVLLVDTTAETGASLDHAVRVAAGLARAYLAAGDRVAAIGFGPVLRWVPPGVGARHYHRVVHALLSASDEESVVEPDVQRLPRQVLPPGAVVIVLSPLHDPLVLDAVAVLRRRGHPTVVMDVMTAEPDPGTDPVDAMALRVWRLDRAAVTATLRSHGVPVVDATAATTGAAGSPDAPGPSAVGLGPWLLRPVPGAAG